METASVSCRECSLRWLASIPMALGTPTVDTVMWRAPMPRSWLMNRAAAVTARRFSNGSPIPMNTAQQHRGQAILARDVQACASKVQVSAEA